ncbi:MAG: hypothetical protein NXH90_14930 [Flavobacteriaceae bacterium]|nr:hypothetical protein [Flavobacteriaceae bacterium]
MNPYKVLLCRSPAFPIFSLYKEKIDKAIASDLKGHQEKINPNTSKNSTFTLEPLVLHIIQNKGKQVFAPVKFEVYFDDRAPRPWVFRPALNLSS